ncbi:tetratricopeptide repeat protein [Usitatibacter palustris]|uniref:Photosystem I assembly protein Ycf3 n=1 Tax=Usitatibacter palustris TaxID=2732487 RepID=A0A6M4H8T3_9PROT|nr:tetratricopeptide repeat protein [Usitatibacter palustris]QJR14427.1 Photosystem I assembly protein Ycf3 [Usitatibacter palustris]
MNFESRRHYWRGRFFLLVNRPARALEGFEAALASDPSNVKAANSLGFAYGLLGKDALALQSFRRALAIADNAVTWFDIGFIHERMQQYPQAIEAFEKAVALSPKIDRAWYGLGMAHAHLGQHVKAAAALENAAELQPMNPHAWYALGMAYYVLGESDKLAAARAHLDRFDPKMALRLGKETGTES